MTSTKSRPTERLLSARSRDEFFSAVIETTGELVAADGIRIAQLTLAPTVSYSVMAHETSGPDPTPALVAQPLNHPLVAHYLKTGFSGWMSIGDLLPGRLWLQHPIYLDSYQPQGLLSHIAAPLRRQGRVTFSLALNRAGRDFDDKERLELERHSELVNSIWMHEERLEAQRAVLSKLEESADAPTYLAVVNPGWGVLYLSNALREYSEKHPGILEYIHARTAERAQWTGALTLPDGARCSFECTRTAFGYVIECHPGPVFILTDRETEVLEQLTNGADASTIAMNAGLSTRTVRKHLEHIYLKLGVHDRVSAIRVARRSGIVRAGW